MLVTLTLVAVANLVVQNCVGMGMATLIGYPPAVGLLAGIASENRIALFIISVISLLGFGVVTWLTTEIRADRAALEAIVAE